MELMIVAGEASGDAHAAALMTELLRRHPDWRFFGCGGEHLAAAGCERLVASAELSVVGLLEVVEHLPRIARLLRRLKRAMLARRPAGVILVDFPDFNLRLAAAAGRAGIPVIYFISPQLWAWRPGRVKLIRRFVRRMICIFPFEQAFYKRHGLDVASVGHPLVDRWAQAEASLAPTGEFRAQLGLDPATELVALLPGSRTRELQFHLPVLMEAAQRLRQERGCAFVLPVAPGLSMEAVRAMIPAALQPHVHLVPPSRFHAAVRAARVAVVASGTATVETALAGTPMVVIYRLSSWTYRLGRRWVKSPHYAMVNLIAGREVVPELIQDRLTPDAVVNWAQRLLPEGETRRQMLTDLQEVRQRLGKQGAIARAANEIELALGLEISS